MENRNCQAEAWGGKEMVTAVDGSVRRFSRMPKHIGVIPDGNRRWAVTHGMEKKDGYRYGIEPGFELYELCRKLGVEELTLYGFTMDNTKRPTEQKTEFQKACVDAVTELAHRDAQLLVIGNEKSKAFPQELVTLRQRQKLGDGGMKVNFLVNYGWEWDLKYPGGPASKDISRIDLLIRWGGRRRLSGFLPIQSVYADFYVVDDMWPDFSADHLYSALEWYQSQDITLGG